MIFIYFYFLMTICDAEIKFARHLGGKYLKINHNMSTYQQLHVKWHKSGPRIVSVIPISCDKLETLVAITT